MKNSKIIGIILTGMGKDGAAGIQHIKALGGITFAQDKESSAIYGMPKAAAETGAVDFEYAPHKIRKKIADLLEGSGK